MPSFSISEASLYTSSHEAHIRVLVWEVVLEVSNGGEHEGNSVGEHTVES